MYKTITLNNLGELSPNLPKLKKLGASLYFLNLKNWGRPSNQINPQIFLSFQLTKHLQLLSLPLSKELWQPEIERSKHDYKYNIIKGAGDDPQKN
jgi:hypothetical protein